MKDITEPKTTAVALGFFDGVHLGHRAVAGEAVKLADAMGITPCAFTFTMKNAVTAAKAGAGLICTEDEKESRLSELGIKKIFCPDFAEFKDMSGEDFVNELLCKSFGAAVLCCGEDFRFGKNAASGTNELSALCKKQGIVLAVVPAVLQNGTVISSTAVRRAISAGDMAQARQLLGRAYSFSFKVEHGKKLGRTINAPTINQHFAKELLLPRFGVYASFARVDGVWHPSVTNIGVKPTVTSEGTALAETCIIGLEQNLYGELVEVAPVSFMRDETKFLGVEQLKAAIEDDIAKAFAICAEYK
ncbi:MAG: riboflavin biosynthesis protein RibF [Hydrogenoanaerobacterium sp.]